MSEHPVDDEEEEYFANDEEEETLLTSASETLDTMAMFMDPEDLMPPIVSINSLDVCNILSQSTE